MSFTVMRRKDGKITPITVSIWDAFKGTPAPRKPKSKPVHVKTEAGKHDAKKSEAKGNGNGNGIGNDEPEKMNNESASTNKDGEQFGAEDNAKIIDMKSNNKTWKEIMEGLSCKCSKSDLQRHWKTINPNRANTESQKEEPAKEFKQSETTSNKPADTSKSKQDGKKVASQPQNDSGQSKTEASEKEDNKAAETETAALNPMRVFSEDYDRQYARQKWLAAASKHFDLTGKRITPEAAQRMAEEK